MTASSMEELVSLCKRRGFIFQSNDIYGGIKGLYDYGPMGVELKNNLKQAWWKSMVYERDDIEGLDASILSAPVVLQQSGHEDTFTDPLVDCRDCKSRWRADQLKSDKCTKPSMSSVSAMNRPNSVMFLTSPSIISPILELFLYFSHGLSTHCLIPSEIRLFSTSISRTITSTFSEVDTIFPG